MKRKFLHPDLGVIEGIVTKQTLFFSYIKLAEPVYVSSPGMAELYINGQFGASQWLKYTITRCFQIGDVIKLPTYSYTSLELVGSNKDKGIISNAA